MSSLQSSGQPRLVVSWTALYNACLDLLRMVEESGRVITTIAPVLRGGMIPATVISYASGIPVGFVINPSNIDLVQSASDTILVVDEICDTGRTFRAVRERFPRALLAAVYAKPEGRMSCCDLHARTAPQDHWVEFPWGE